MTFQPNGGGLVRAIRRPDLLALIVNNIVGAGLQQLFIVAVKTLRRRPAEGAAAPPIGARTA
jgi:hypothetical protein